MDNAKRRDSGMMYQSDDAIFEAQKPARRLTQKLNTMDRSDLLKSLILWTEATLTE